MQNNLEQIYNYLNPQQKMLANNIYNQMMMSGNPEQFLTQRYGKDKGVQKALSIKKDRNNDEFNSYLDNVIKSFNR